MLILFDLDGTLLDTSEAHAYAAQRALRSHGQASDAASVHRFLVAHDAASADIEEAVYFAVWREMQRLYRKVLHTVQPFPGAPDALHTLTRAGHRLGVVTSKRRWAVERELAQTGLHAAFEVVVCRDDTQQHKPHPQPLLLAQSRLAMRGGAYLGDQETDVVAARAAGMLPLGAGWGWSGSGALLAAGAAVVLQDFCELEGALHLAVDAAASEDVGEPAV